MDKDTFNCEKCGDCCKIYTIKLDNSDIDNIKNLGYSERLFVDKDPFDRTKILKKKGKRCVFLSEIKDKTYCKIYDSRPKICKTYPFFQENPKSCKPAELKFY